MHTQSHRSTVIKLSVIIVVVLLASAAVAYTFLPSRAAYTQILLDISPSDSTSLAPIVSCARSAVDTAVQGSGSTIDIALVSGSPAAMQWTTVDAQESFWTRFSIGKVNRERQANTAKAMADVQTLIHSKRPPNSSDELASLAAAHVRAVAMAPDIKPSRRITVMCGDGHFVGAGGSAYKANLSETGIAKILDVLRKEDLLPDWDGAGFYMGINVVDHIDMGASREALIHRFWEAWAAASHAKFV